MTNKEAKDVLQEQIDRYGQEYDTEGIEALEIAINVLEQQPSEDAISRLEVRDLLATWLTDNLTEETREALETIDGKIEDMQSVIPKAETITDFADRCRECGTIYGKLLHPYKSNVACECSVCHRQMPITNDFKFCPNCGTRMIEPQESERDD